MRIVILVVLAFLLFSISSLHKAYAETKFDKDIRCLAVNIYHEARGEPEIGQMMVAFVTMNRVNDHRFPNDVCSVVYQPHQFSWTKHDKSIDDWALYHKIKERAADVYFAYLDDRITYNLSKYGKNTLYFSSSGHLDKVFKRVVVIGNHIFYSDEEIDKETNSDHRSSI